MRPSRFTFNAGVDPSSLPGGGVAVGSINITTGPQRRSGARRRSRSRTIPRIRPATSASSCSGPRCRTIRPPRAARGSCRRRSTRSRCPRARARSSSWAGARSRQGAFTCFTTCGCPDPGACIATFMDPVPGAPFVLDTTPTTADPAPPAIDACSIANDTVIIRVNEPLDPNGIDLDEREDHQRRHRRPGPGHARVPPGRQHDGRRHRLADRLRRDASRSPAAGPTRSCSDPG